MNKLQAIQQLKAFDKKGRYVFTKGDMAKLFPEDKLKALSEGLNRLVKAGLLKRACRGVIAVRDLKRVGRNLNLLQEEEF